MTAAYGLRAPPSLRFDLSILFRFLIGDAIDLIRWDLIGPIVLMQFGLIMPFHAMVLKAFFFFFNPNINLVDS